MKRELNIFIILSLFIFIVSSCTKDCGTQLANCRIASPSNGQEVAKGEVVTISFDDSNLSSNVAEVRFFIDGVGKSSAVIFPFNYQWDTQNESIGDHSILAKSIGSSGELCSDEITVKITGEQVGEELPVADFSANPISGSSPMTVNFIDLSTANTNSWSWSFGDGTTSNDQNPEHIFTDDGLYAITLVVTNNFGSDSLIKPDYINVGGITTGVPCPDIPTITDNDGNVYNTVLIGDQCWMKENLRAGNFISGTNDMTDNGVIEKYCIDNNPTNCETYGGLYQWAEIMNYTTVEGTQGICPTGWHIPSDQDWKILEMELGLTQAEADASDWRGENEGSMLKTTSGWVEGGNGTNSTGWSGLPAGYRGTENGGFAGVTENGYWWTSTNFSDVQTWYRQLGRYVGQINRTYNYNGSGISVRCVMD